MGGVVVWGLLEKRRLHGGDQAGASSAGERHTRAGREKQIKWERCSS